MTWVGEMKFRTSPTSAGRYSIAKRPGGQGNRAIDVAMQGKVIRKLERLRCFIASANRDPRQFSDPDTFAIMRSPNPHVAFGAPPLISTYV